jgi:hypothetical protein
VKSRVDWLTVNGRIRRHQATRERTDGECRSIAKAWQCEPKEALGTNMWPGEASVLLLRQLNRLSKMCSPHEARCLLADAIRQRTNKAGSISWTESPHVLTVDVTETNDSRQGKGSTRGEIWWGSPRVRATFTSLRTVDSVERARRAGRVGE